MDYATTLNIDQQGRIIIPAKVRKALQLHTGDGPNSQLEKCLCCCPSYKKQVAYRQWPHLFL